MAWERQAAIRGENLLLTWIDAAGFPGYSLIKYMRKREETQNTFIRKELMKTNRATALHSDEVEYSHAEDKSHRRENFSMRKSTLNKQNEKYSLGPKIQRRLGGN